MNIGLPLVIKYGYSSVSFNDTTLLDPYHVLQEIQSPGGEIFRFFNPSVN